MIAGAFLGAIIILLLFFVVSLRLTIVNLRKSIAPLADANAALRTEIVDVARRNEALVKENAEIKKPTIMYLTNEQIHMLAMQVNNIRDSATTTVN